MQEQMTQTRALGNSTNNLGRVRRVCFDWENGALQAFDGTSMFVLTKEGFLELRGLREYDELVIEKAHLQPRSTARSWTPDEVEKIRTLRREAAEYGITTSVRGPSRAQIYTSEELEQLDRNLKDAGIVLRLFPEREIKSAHELTDIKKEDERDAEAIFRYLQVKTLTLRKWELKELGEPELHALEIKADMDHRLNEMRAGRPNPEDPTDVRQYVYSDEFETMYSLFAQIWEQLSPETRNFYGMGVKGPKRTMKWTQLASLYVAVRDRHGNLRVTPDNSFIGQGFIWSKVLRMHSYHMNAGVARSNLMHYGLQNFEQARLKEGGFVYTHGKLKGKALNPFGKNLLNEGAEAARKEARRIWRSHTKEVLRALATQAA